MEEIVVSSERIYEGRGVNLRRDTVRLPSGRQTTREVVEHRKCVTILPIADDGRLLLVRQFRLPARAILLEAPAGNMDDGESPEETARRELREETGHDCRQLEPLLEFYPAPGFCEEYMYCFLATGLFEAGLAPDEDEILDVQKLKLDETLAAINERRIIDAKSIAIVFAYALRVAELKAPGP